MGPARAWAGRAILAAHSLVPPAIADGGAFVRTEVESGATIPDQRAVLAWQDGTETLVIDTSIVTGAGDVAWLVPVPSPPDVTPSTVGLFDTLDALVRPAVVEPGTRTAATLAVMFAAAIVLALGAPWLGRRPGPIGIACAGVVTLAIVFVAGLLVPAFGRVRAVPGESRAAEYPGVSVLSRERIGSYDIAVLTGERADAVLGWLTEHGYRADQRAVGAIERYVRDGWCFVASRLSPVGAGGRWGPHPLCLRFASERPVYPMCLTGAVSDRLELELIVLGNERASCRGARTMACVARQSLSGLSWETSHEEVRRVAGKAAVATRLRGVYDRAGMDDDIEISWGRFEQMQHRQYSPGSAAAESATVASIIGLFALPAAWRALGGRGARACGCALLLFAGAGGVYFATRDVVPMRTVRTRWRYDAVAPRELVIRLAQEISGLGSGALADARAAAARIASELSREWNVPMLRECDSPGGYRLLEGERGIELVAYGARGDPVRWPVAGRLPDR